MVLAGRRSLIVELSASLFNPALFPVFALQFFFMYFYSHIEYLLPIFITHQYSEYFVSVVFFVNTLFVIFAQTVFRRILMNCVSVLHGARWRYFTGGGWRVICGQRHQQRHTRLL